LKEELNSNKGSVSAFDKMWETKKKNLDYLKPKSGFTLSTDLQVHFFIKERASILREYFCQTKGKKMLNCGCGTGQWSIPFAEMGYSVTNLDLSQNAIDYTREAFSKKGLTGSFVKDDLLNMPFESECFDVIVSFGVLEHFEDIEKPIKEMVRVLKPGGVFFADVITKRLSVHTIEDYFNSITAVIITALRFKLNLQLFKMLKPDFYENSLSAKEYARVIEISGLSHLKTYAVRSYPFLLLPLALEKIYVGFLRLFRNIFKTLDTSEIKLLLLWSVIFSFVAIKPEKGQ